jgi:hypothetical protein
MITVIVRDTHHRGKKKTKQVSAILEVYIAQLATRQANEDTHMVSIYLLLIQFKIPAERSTFFVKAQTLSVNDASESEGYLTSRRLS